MKSEAVLQAAKELIRAMNENRCHSEAFDDLAGAIKEAESAPAERKIVQIAESGGNEDWSLTALCNDGTVWVRGNSAWARLPPIPQGESS